DAGGNDKHDEQSAGTPKDPSADRGNDPKPANDSADAAQQQSPQTAGGPPAVPGALHSGEQSKKDDVKPLDAPEAGLGGSGEDKQKPEDQKAAGAAAEQGAPQPQPPTRMVGGGRVEPQNGDGALAGAFGALQQLKDGDAPAVLFDRMNRADGQPKPKRHEK